jgi:hypothetical protein
MNINWTLQRLNIWVFRRFICICLYRLSFLDNPTNKEYILQKKIMSFGPEFAELCRNLYPFYESSEFTKSDSFITPDLEDFFSALTLKFDFLPRK